MTSINKIGKILKGDFSKNDEPFTADKAWCETTYGSGSYKPLEKRIKDKQAQIKNIIRGRFNTVDTEGSASNKSYRCIIDIEEDLKHNINDVFKPFIDGGFNIINLSERIDEIKDENVYLISWKHAFENLAKKKDNDTK